LYNLVPNTDRANGGDKDLVPYISKFASTLFPVMQNQTARKSTNSSMGRIQVQSSSSTSSRTQGQTKFLDLFDVMVKPEIVRFKPHGCSSKCVHNWELNIENRVKSLNPLLIPMIYGWQRHVATQSKDSNTKNRRCVSYMAPCGRRLRNIKEVDKYLYYTNSQMALDMFSFDSLLRSDRVFEANKTYVNIDDITDGKEDVPISCVNCMDDELPPTIDYSKVRLALDGVPLNTDESLLEGCDCTDGKWATTGQRDLTDLIELEKLKGCKDRLKCSCWRKTYEATTFTRGKNNIDETVGYKGRRLLQMVSTGIFECNSRCKCDHRCSNRVVQNPISVRLQLFKTASKGWGLRCLDDVPKGGFLCVYTGQLLTEEQSDIRGMELGDEYFAELDFIECVRRSRIDQLEQSGELDDNNLSSMDINEMATITKTKTNYIKSNHQVPKQVQQTSENDDCIELSSDENDSCSPDNKQQTRINEKFFTNSRNPFFYANYLRSSDVFIMDAKICGNIGRYFNHSCTPNIFVQNVFVDTYDLRFPWISFFSSQFIKAGTELCWDYNYTLDSVQGKQIKCHCGSSQCRGRLL
jgi:histone-lysine N-methyltransferase SETDB1